MALVTRGLIARGVLMKLYQHSVVYFEDLRDIGHCEFVIMTKHRETGRFSMLIIPLFLEALPDV